MLVEFRILDGYGLGGLGFVEQAIRETSSLGLDMMGSTRKLDKVV